MPEATLQSSRNRSRNTPLLDLDLEEIGWTLNESDYLAIIATGETITAESIIATGSGECITAERN